MTCAFYKENRMYEKLVWMYQLFSWFRTSFLVKWKRTYILCLILELAFHISCICLVYVIHWQTIHKCIGQCILWLFPIIFFICELNIIEIMHIYYFFYSPLYAEIHIANICGNFALQCYWWRNEIWTHNLDIGNIPYTGFLSFQKKISTKTSFYHRVKIFLYYYGAIWNALYCSTHIRLLNEHSYVCLQRHMSNACVYVYVK